MSWPVKMFRSLVSSTGVFLDGDWVESKDQDPNGGVRLIQLADVGVNEYINKSSRFMTHDAADRLRCTFLEPGDILIARMPDPIGRACIFPGDPKPCVTVVDVCIVRPCSNEIDSRWLMHMINSEGFHHQILQYVTGTTRQRISRGNLAKLDVEVPPLAEQQRIAAILDKADALRRKRRQAIDLADQFLRSVFLEMFGDPITNPKGWDTALFGEVGALDRGKSKHRPRNDPALLGGEYPLIQTGDVANSKGYIRHYKSTYSEFGLKQSKIWPEGTLCITIAANIAKTGILTFDACFPDSVVGFAPNDQVTVEYVRYWLGFLQKMLEANAPESAQKNINLEILRGLEIPVPPKEQQDKFSSIVAKAIELADKTSSFEKSDSNLFASLSQQAFRGEL